MSEDEMAPEEPSREGRCEAHHEDGNEDGNTMKTKEVVKAFLMASFFVSHANPVAKLY